MVTSRKQPLSGEAAQLLDKVGRVLRTRHYSHKTFKAYMHWIVRFLRAQAGQDPRKLREHDVNRFLSDLAIKLHVASSTQNQALAALKFFYKNAVGEPLESLDLVRARGPQRVPTALTGEEVGLVLMQMSGVPLIVSMLMYGGGLRLDESLTLRVKDIDFRRRELLIREGKGKKDRITVLPLMVIEPLQAHLNLVRAQHQKDLDAGLGRVPMPYALHRKYPNAPTEWIWQWVFPARSHYVDRQTGARHRHHLHESVVQKAMRAAGRAAGVTKHVTPHVMRHSFATEMVSNFVDIRTVQELLGHKDVRTTQRYLHVLTGGNHGVRSPLDGLTLTMDADGTKSTISRDERQA